MPETEVKEPVVASIGKPERIPMNAAPMMDNANQNGGNNIQKENTESKVLDEKQEDKEVPELTDDQLKQILKSRNIEFESFDTLREKLTTPAANTEITQEQKDKIAADFEKRQLDLFLENKGTVEQFAAIKNILAMDNLKEMGITEIKKEMQDANFSQEEIEAVLQERYYQKNPDELEQGLDEEDDDFEKRKADFKKKHDFAATKIENRGQAIKKNAESVLNNLRTAIEQSEISKRESEELEKKFQSTTDEVFSKIPKTITLELGKGADGTDIAPVNYDVDDADIEAVKNLLKDPAQRNNFLYTPEGNLNVQSIGVMMVENANMKKALHVVALEATSRTVEHFMSKFGHRTAQSLGLNGNGQQNNLTGQKGQPASFGKTQRVQAGR